MSDFMSDLFACRAVAQRWWCGHLVHSVKIYLLSTCSIADSKEDKRQSLLPLIL